MQDVDYSDIKMYVAQVEISSSAHTGSLTHFERIVTLTSRLFKAFLDCHLYTVTKPQLLEVALVVYATNSACLVS